MAPFWFYESWLVLIVFLRTGWHIQLLSFTSIGITIVRHLHGKKKKPNWAVWLFQAWRVHKHDYLWPCLWLKLASANQNVLMRHENMKYFKGLACESCSVSSLSILIFQELYRGTEIAGRDARASLSLQDWLVSSRESSIQEGRCASTDFLAEPNISLPIRAPPWLFSLQTTLTFECTLLVRCPLLELT